MKRLALVCILLTGLLAAASARGQEIRAFWADGFNDGFKSPEQVDQLLARLRTAHCNAIFAQMRKSADAYYLSRYDPWAADDPGHFDALAYLIDRAHHGTPRIAVHAWLNTCAVGKSHGNPHHIAAEHPEWLSLSDKGEDYDKEATKIDPGNPDAADWTFRVYLDVARRYDVDGVHFDFVRFGGANWGYNPVSVARYNARYGTAGQPKADDPRWKQWRRDQVTALVRKVYAMAAAVRPKMAVSAATITWGDGPHDLRDPETGHRMSAEQLWNEKSAPMNRVYQDWRAWIREGILDLNCLMSYYQESKHPDMFRHWTDWCKDNQYDRWAVPSSGIWLNPIADSLTQIRQLRAPTKRGHRPGGGVLLYSYAGTNAGPDGKEVNYNDAFYAALAQPSALSRNPPFEVPAGYPEMPWKERPKKGIIKGFVHTADGLNPIDGAKVRLTGRAHRTILTDGTGFFAFVDVPPGSYTVHTEEAGYRGRQRKVSVAAGEVATCSEFLGSAATPIFESVPEALTLPAASPVRLRSAEVVGGTDVFPDELFVRSLEGGPNVRVRLDHRPVVPFQRGDVITVAGTMAVIDGEPAIEDALARLVDIRLVPDAEQTAAPGTLGPGLSRVTGRVSDVKADRAVLQTDKGATVEVMLAGRKDPGVESIEQPLKSPDVGTVVAVTGIETDAKSPEGASLNRIRPRTQEDIQIVPTPLASRVGTLVAIALIPCVLALAAIGYRFRRK